MRREETTQKTLEIQSVVKKICAEINAIPRRGSGRRYPLSIEELIRKLLSLEINATEISKLTGISIPTIYKWKYFKKPLKKNPLPYSLTEQPKVRELTIKSDSTTLSDPLALFAIIKFTNGIQIQIPSSHLTAALIKDLSLAA
jgi:hypothetical protein